MECCRSDGNMSEGHMSQLPMALTGQMWDTLNIKKSNNSNGLWHTEWKKKKTTHESMVIFFKNQVWNGRRKSFLYRRMTVIVKRTKDSHICKEMPFRLFINYNERNIATTLAKWSNIKLLAMEQSNTMCFLIFCTKKDIVSPP